MGGRWSVSRVIRYSQAGQSRMCQEKQVAGERVRERRKGYMQRGECRSEG